MCMIVSVCKIVSHHVFMVDLDSETKDIDLMIVFSERTSVGEKDCAKSSDSELTTN